MMPVIRLQKVFSRSVRMGIKIGNGNIINGYETIVKDGKYKIKKPNGEIKVYKNESDYMSDFFKIGRGEKI